MGGEGAGLRLPHWTVKGFYPTMASHVVPVVKSLLPMQETEGMQGQPLGGEDSLEEGMATHFSILAWRIPWTEEPGGLQSMGSQRGRHD